MKAKFVYAISLNSNPLLVKIGKTSNWGSRSKALKVGQQTKREVLARVFDMTFAEKCLHHRYKRYRVPQSEWFLAPTREDKLEILRNVWTFNVYGNDGFLDEDEPSGALQLYPTVFDDWRIYQSRYLVLTPTGNPASSFYEVDLWAINSHRELVDWLFHIRGKNPEFYCIEGFIEAMSRIFHKCGWNELFTGRECVTEYLSSSKAEQRGDSRYKQLLQNVSSSA